jgi:type II secretory pathway component PulF
MLRARSKRHRTWRSQGQEHEIWRAVKTIVGLLGPVPSVTVALVTGFLALAAIVAMYSLIDSFD